MSTEAAVFPRNFVRQCVLLLLREGPAHGYDLADRLRAFGLPGDDPGRLYRTLRALEAEGMVASAWETSPHGPDRRIYTLTRAGSEALHAEATALRAGADALAHFLSRYEEFGTLSRRPATAGSARPPRPATAGRGGDT